MLYFGRFNALEEQGRASGEGGYRGRSRYRDPMMQYGSPTGDDEKGKKKKKKQRIYRYTLPESKESPPSPPCRAQYPGGLTRWLTRVHFGTSATAIGQFSRAQSRSRNKHTMHALPVFLRVAVKQRVLVSRLHLGLGRHLQLPPLHRRRDHALLCERVVDARHDAVDAPQPLSVSVLLHAGHAPWDFPAVVGQRGSLAGSGGRGGGVYQRRPPFSGCEGRRKPNIAVGEIGGGVFNWGGLSVSGLSVCRDGRRRPAGGGGLVSCPE